MQKRIIGCYRSGRFGELVVMSLFVALTASLMGQTVETGVLRGKITDLSGSAVVNATVTATSAENGQTRSTRTGEDGSYQFDSLPSGDYVLKIEGRGFKALEILPARVARNGMTIFDEKLEPEAKAGGNPTPAQQENLPNAPSSSTTAPSLSDLGLSPEQTRGNLQEQALLDKRTHMLKIHQRMGLITTIPLIATVVTSVNAGGKSEGTASRDLHVALGALTGDLYGITAYYAIRAPRIPGSKKHGPIKFHEAMAWIHGPGMILTPVLGAMAFSQKNDGERVHGIARAHGPVAIVTAGAFGVALLSVSVKF